MNWKERARRARLSNGFIATALGYSNGAKISQAWGWAKTPAAVRLLIVVAERVPPQELDGIIAEISEYGTEAAIDERGPA